MNKNRLLTFDLIRLIGILIILFHHLPGYTFNFYDLRYLGIDLDLSPLNQLNRYFGLSLFVFMSGYFISFRKPRFYSLRLAKSFFLKRLVRIFPLYYLALVFFCYIYKYFDPRDILIHVLGLQSVTKIFIESSLPTLWFVSLLIVYYSLFIVLMFGVIPKKYRAALAFIVGTLLLIFCWNFPIFDFRIALYIWIFFFGIYCAETKLLDTRTWRQFDLLIFGLFLTISAICYRLASQGDFKTSSSVLSYILVNILMVTFILSVYLLSDKICRFFVGDKLRQLILWTSYSSYCAYLFHRPVFFYLKMILEDFFELNRMKLASLLLITFGTVLVFLISFGLQSFYDRCLLKVLNRGET